MGYIFLIYLQTSQKSTKTLKTSESFIKFLTILLKWSNKCFIDLSPRKKS